MSIRLEKKTHNPFQIDFCLTWGAYPAQPSFFRKRLSPHCCLPTIPGNEIEIVLIQSTHSRQGWSGYDGGVRLEAIMSLLNPLNARTKMLTFAVAGAGTVTDALGNAVPGKATVKVEAFVVPLGLNNVAQVQAALGTDRAGIPVKVRAATKTGLFPAAIQRGVVVEATLIYAGQPARLALMISGDPNPHVAGAGLLPALGQSVVGLIVVG